MNTKALIIHKEEGLISAVINMWDVDGRAERSSELILLIGRSPLPYRIEIIARIQYVVLQKAPGTAVNIVCPGFDDGVNDGAISTPKLCTVGVRLDLKLLQSIHWRLDDVVSFV